VTDEQMDYGNIANPSSCAWQLTERHRK